MLWVNHQITTTTLAYFCGIKEPHLLALTALSSILPDSLEYLFRIRIVKHRTITHSIMFWIIILTYSFLYLKTNLPEFLDFWYSIAFGIAGHLIEDSLTKTGIPLFINKPRLALKFFRTGSFYEYIISGICISVLFLKNFC